MTLTKEREELVINNINLVNYVIRNFFNVSKDNCLYEDFYQTGCLGLILAAIRFETKRSNSFSTYAVAYIDGYIRSYKNFQVPLIRLVATDLPILSKILELSKDNYSIDEIITITKCPRNKILSIINILNVNSLDDGITDEEGESRHLIDTIEDKSINVENHIIETQMLKEALIKTRNRLKMSEKNKMIWDEYVSLCENGGDSRQSVLANKYGVSNASIGNVIKRGRETLKQIIKEEAN